jgi:hypothetical protein
MFFIYHRVCGDLRWALDYANVCVQLLNELAVFLNVLVTPRTRVGHLSSLSGDTETAEDELDA